MSINRGTAANKNDNNFLHDILTNLIAVAVVGAIATLFRLNALISVQATQIESLNRSMEINSTNIAELDKRVIILEHSNYGSDNHRDTNPGN